MRTTLPGLARLSVAGCAPFLALVHEGRAQALADWNARHGNGLMGVDDMVPLLQHWRTNRPLLSEATPDRLRSHDLRQFQVHAALQPRSVYCTIGNYQAQLLEALLDAGAGPGTASLAERRAAGILAIEERKRGEPYIVMKPASSVAGPTDVLALKPGEDTLDWEVEVGAVLGAPAWHLHAEEALAHVAGYCTVNDITLRQSLFRADPKGMGTDFLQAKGGRGWLPLGPLFVHAARIRDPKDLVLQLRLNGESMQQGCANDMLFSMAEQIAYLSRHVDLQPGDVVCTGSPAGFGSHHQRFLRPGDVVEAEVLGLGAQRTPVHLSA